MIESKRLPDIEPETSRLTSEQATHLLKLQRDVLAEVVQKADPQSALDLLCFTAQSLLPDSVCSIMLFDENRSALKVRAAPSLNREATEALNGLKPGPNAGSCGTAVYTAEPQFVCDTCSDPRWSSRDFQEFAEAFNIRACWSVPIRIGKDVVGSLALSCFEKRSPSEFHRLLLETGAYLAGIVLEREREQQRLWTMAYYDSLTGLPNRRLFNVQLLKMIEQARKTRCKMALLFLDLDHFKDINDTLGHHAGDTVLKQVAENLKSTLRPSDLIARLGGDEFVILLAHADNVLDVQHVADKIMAAVKRPVFLQEKGYHLSASIGISLFPDDGEDLHTLHKNADLAMYDAKSRGRGRYIYYRPDLARFVESRTALVKDIRQALEQQAFTLEFQPQAAAADGSFIGAEALIRWVHPQKGNISPLDFIPLAEETGQIIELGEWVLTSACRQCMMWWQEGLKEFVLAVNLSVKQLQEGFSEHLLAMIVGELGFPLRCLELEITESLVMETGGEALEELERLRQAGVSISMDDFGTGHSSLSQLKRMPISKLKIDRSFVRDIPEDPNDMIIARTIIAMGHSLGLEIVAEGVENEVQRNFLRKEGCDLLQGYLISRPLSPRAFQEFLHRQVAV